MGKRVQRTLHHGKEILFADFSNTGERESLETWDELRQEILKEPGAVLVLVDATNTKMSLAIMNKARDVAATLKSIPGTRVAFAGMTTLQRSAAQVHAKTMHLDVYYCAKLEEGRDWLVK